MTIEIPLKVDGRLGLNKQYSGKHWSKRSAEADEVHFLTRLAISRLNVTKCFTSPVQITFKYNSRLDCDNHGYLNKLIVDGLKGKIITDDDKRYVRRIITEFQSESQYIIVEVEEITQ